MIPKEQQQIVSNIKTSCTKCTDEFKGFIYIPETDLFRKCECTLRMELASDCFLANIPSKFINMTWKDYMYDIPNNIKKYIAKMDYWLDKGIGLYLYGPNGSGKSFLMAQLAKHAIKSGYKVQFFKLDQLIDITLNASKPGNEHYDGILEKIREADLICIDEVEKVYKKSSYNSSMSFSETLYDTLFRNSSNNKQSILVTANTSLSNIQAIHGQHISSLFSENLVETEINNPDFRNSIKVHLKTEFEKDIT